MQIRHLLFQGEGADGNLCCHVGLAVCDEAGHGHESGRCIASDYTQHDNTYIYTHTHTHIEVLD